MKMKAAWILLAVSILLCCNDINPPSEDPNTQALRALKEHGNADSFLIILSDTGEQHYIQFEVDGDGLIFDRPVSAASERDLPVVSARFYKRVASRPDIADAAVERFLSVEEAERAVQYLNRWGLASASSYTATEGSGGEIVQYFEGFHGRFTVPEDRFSEFIRGFFSDVFQLNPANLRLHRRTDKDA
jgi:hypothetical protein